MKPGDKWPPRDVVRIDWIDASGDTGFVKESAIEEVSTPVTTIAFLIRKTRAHYLTGGSIMWDADAGEYFFGDRNHIPKGMVKSFEVVTPRAAPKRKANGSA